MKLPLNFAKSKVNCISIRYRKLLLQLAICLALLSPASAIAQSDALNFSDLNGGNDLLLGSYSLGWSFAVQKSGIVTALGFYDSLKDGLDNSHEVGIYTADDCRLIASTTVRPSDPLKGFFRFRDVVPVTLEAGKTYYIAGVTAGSDPYAFNVGALQIDPSIRFIGFSIFGDTQTTSTLECPNGTQLIGTKGDFGPSFQITIESLQNDKVTPKTSLENPPAVNVNNRTATLTFQKFSGVGLIKGKLASQVARAAKAKAKLSFEYAAEIKRTANVSGKSVKGDIKNLTSKRNIITLKNLKTGTYSARYRVNIYSTSGSNKKLIGKTKFSPAAGFAIF